MTRLVFQGMGAAVVAPTGDFLANKGTRTAWVLPILAPPQGIRPYGPYPIRSNGTASDANSMKERFLHIDLEKRVTHGSPVAGAQLDGWGIAQDGKDLLAPVNKVDNTADDLEPAVRITTIGGQWPQGRHQGLLYLESSQIEKNRMPISNAGGWPVSGFAPESLMTVACDDARYVGFNARIDGGTWPNMKVVFRSRSDQPVETQYAFDIDFSSRLQVDVTATEYYTGLPDSTGNAEKVSVKMIDRDTTEGAIFLNVRRLYAMLQESAEQARLLMSIPKLPFWLGL